MTTKHLSMTTVPTGSLSPNPWNTNRITDPANEERLRKSMRRLGVFKPILVRELQDGAFEILGGEHRWKMAAQMGIESVPIVNLGRIDDRRAKEIGLADNGRYGNDDFGELAKLIGELGTDVFDFVPYNEADFKALQDASSNIDLDDLDSVDPGARKDTLPELPSVPTSQLMRFKVPVGDTAWVTQLVESEMKRQGFSQEDALTNAGHALVSLLRKAVEA